MSEKRISFQVRSNQTRSRKFKTFKNIITTLFFAKMGREMLRMRKKKIFPSPFLPNLVQKINKIQYKFQKIKKQHSNFISTQNRTGKAENEKKKKILSPFLPNEFQKISKKQFNNSKNKKNTIPALFLAKTGRETPRMRKKNFALSPFRPNPVQKISKKQYKNSKN